MSIVGRTLQIKRTQGFISVSVARDQGGVDSGLVEVLAVVRRSRRISWKAFGRLFDEEGQKRVNVELMGPEFYGTRLTFSHFLFVDFYKIQGRAPDLSTTR